MIRIRSWNRPGYSLVILGGFVLAALGVGGSLAAQWAGSPPWQGPALGGRWLPTALTQTTNALAVDGAGPAVLYAGTNDGVWRSQNGGAHWLRAGTGLGGANVLALAVDPANRLLYAGTAGGMVFAEDERTSGAWVPVGRSLGGSPVASLAISTSRPRVILAGTIGAVYRGTQQGGRWQWQQVVTTGGSTVTSVTWLPDAPGRALASVFGSAPPVLATADGGRTWHAASAGLDGSLPTQALLPSGTPPGSVVLSTMGAGVWEELAGTGPWRDISAGLPERHAMPLAALPGSNGSVIYAGTMGFGIYVRQGAKAWQPFGNGLLGVQNTILALAVVPQGPHALPLVVAATDAGVSRYVPAR
jgi:hypothetical protein